MSFTSLQIVWGDKQHEGRSVPAEIAQLGERKTEDLKVPGSIPGRGIFAFPCSEAGKGKNA